MTETPRSEELFGIAKKMTLELEKLPLHSHAAVISLLNTAVQHRQIAVKAEEEDKMRTMQQQHLDLQKAAAERAEPKLVIA